MPPFNYFSFGKLDSSLKALATMNWIFKAVRVTRTKILLFVLNALTKKKGKKREKKKKKKLVLISDRFFGARFSMVKN